MQNKILKFVLIFFVSICLFECSLDNKTGIWNKKKNQRAIKEETKLTQLSENNKNIQKEINAKSKSIVGVLDPFSSKGNTKMLQRAGFIDIFTIAKYICFEVFIAIK